MRISDWSSDVCSSDLASLLAEMMANINNHYDELVAILIADGGRPRATAEWEIKWVQNGRAPCRERVCQYVKISVVGVSLQKKTRENKSDKRVNKTLTKINNRKY